MVKRTSSLVMEVGTVWVGHLGLVGMMVRSISFSSISFFIKLEGGLICAGGLWCRMTWCWLGVSEGGSRSVSMEVPLLVELRRLEDGGIMVRSISSFSTSIFGL